MDAPKLRFKDFKEKWEEKKLCEISDIKTGPFGSTLHEEDYVQTGTPIITVEHLGEQGVVHLNLPMVSDDDKTRLKSYHLKEGDVVFSRVGSVDRSCLISSKEDGWLFSGRLLRVRLTNENYNSKFLNQNFKNDAVKYRIRSAAVGQTMASLNTEILKNFHLNFPPSLPEQTKIANFLTAIDEKITQLTKKCELLAQYKKGMMQKIFSQKLRFKDEDGREFPEWNQTILGEVADSNIRWSLTGGPFGSNLKAEDYTDNGVRIIQLQNIGDGIFNDDYKIFTSAIKADELLSCNIYPGEIIISKMGDPVARCCIMPSSHDRYLMASDGIRLVVNRSLFNTKYIHDFINYETFRKNALEASTGSTRRRIGLDELKKLPVIYPCLAEQTKIANFLTAIDDKITQAQTQLDAVKLYKKSLLQQLFV